MELLLSSLNVVFPLFVMMTAGWLIKKAGLMTDDGFAEMNRANVRFFLPIMQFINVYEGNLFERANRVFFMYVVIAAVILFLLCIYIMPVFIKDKERRVAFLLGVYRPNIAIYGLPLAQSILGDARQVSDVFVMISVAILTTNFFAVMAIELYKGESIKPLTLVFRSFKNPIMYGIMLGMAFQFLPFSLPPILASPIRSMAAVATPLAFAALGASFTLKGFRRNIRTISAAAFLKLVLTPLAAISIGVLLLGFRGASLVALLCVFATPTAVNVLPLVKEAGADDKLASEITVFTTGASVLTIFCFVYFFKLAGFF